MPSLTWAEDDVLLIVAVLSATEETLTNVRGPPETASLGIYVAARGIRML